MGAIETLTERAALLRESLQKSQTITDGIVSILGSFDHRLSALEAAMRPTQVRTHAVRIAHENIDKTLKSAEVILGQFDRTREAEIKILKGPHEDVESYLEAVDQLRSVLRFFNSNKSFRSSDGVLGNVNNLLANQWSLIAFLIVFRMPSDHHQGHQGSRVIVIKTHQVPIILSIKPKTQRLLYTHHRLSLLLGFCLYCFGLFLKVTRSAPERSKYQDDLYMELHGVSLKSALNMVIRNATNWYKEVERNVRDVIIWCSKSKDKMVMVNLEKNIKDSAMARIKWRDTRGPVQKT
ncbi:putative Exocyst complex component EXO70A1-like [Cocos nucifera]|uniref:Putative Exocyst complex component EXO70A1-like n=1 Tax=Cocos nucifera TaxID=13894 RepID=A0A8K0I1H2_COCNU|nr:putative Exocyst complex component EXO70A1-like [Cocos nucifera]